VIFVIITFAAIVGLIVGAYWVFILRADQSESAALRRRLKSDHIPAAIRKDSKILRPTQKLSGVATLNTLLEQSGRIVEPLQRDLTQAGMNITVATLLLSAGTLALAVYVAVTYFTSNRLLALGFGFIAVFVPFIVVKRKKSQRLQKFEEQFPEAIDLIGRAIRAGHAFTTGLAMAAEEIGKPVGEEFQLLYDRQNYGMPLPDAMRAFAVRVPLIDARFFVTAVLTQRETGGNLGEVLDNLASVIRDRFRVKRQVRVLTAHGRITGWILAAMPPALAAALMVVAPGHMRMLVSDPIGVQMIIGALVLQVLGTLIIRKLVNIPY
jgi:tight adherence protein B